MATAAFKSTSKRSSINSSSSTKDAESDNRHRRSRSLSRFSGRYNNEIENEFLVPKKNPKFVNTERGSAGFPEISLDDLVSEFFPSENNHDRGRSSLRSSGNSSSSNSMSGDVITRRGRSVSRQRGQASVQDSNLGGGSGISNSRRGRSVSRQHGTVGDVKVIQESSFGNKGVDNSRRRRSASVAKYQFSDSESDKSINSENTANFNSSRIVNDQRSLIHMPTAKTSQRVLRMSLSQIDLSRSHDGYSSQSSAITDDESQDARSSRNGTERTIRAVYAQKKVDHPVGDGGETGLYDVMRKELRSAVQEIRTELEEVMVKTKPSDSTHNDNLQLNNANVLQAVSVIRDSYATRLEQSEKRKHDLLAEIVVEEQRGRELSKIVKDLLPDANNAVAQKPARVRKRSNDRSRMSKCLTEEAEKYFEGFISNVEDTDISSLDGERSDASSKIGGRANSKDYIVHFEAENRVLPAKLTSLPKDEMDGVVLPWLEWETTSDVSPVVCKSTSKVSLTPGNNVHDTAQELVQGMSTGFNKTNCFISSRGSWSPGGDSLSDLSKDLANIMNGEVDSKPKEPWFDMDEYLHAQREESRILENWRQRGRISSGGLLLCNSKYF
ncbi:uncharacterized protein LOC113297043 isoform X1 [Papaver somniferum]|uniref:uncharacterized protein LOC113297043 isoform X1 n=1 Tax=Papaver somniferum TaxID=3469 RepID=UPI000E6F7926|nr:uncharacterized protein LOC113297043 isoform X1 [Papaver somniferum]